MIIDYRMKIILGVRIKNDLDVLKILISGSDKMYDDFVKIINDDDFTEKLEKFRKKILDGKKVSDSTLEKLMEDWTLGEAIHNLCAHDYEINDNKLILTNGNESYYIGKYFDIKMNLADLKKEISSFGFNYKKIKARPTEQYELI